MTPELEEYIENHISPEPDYLKKIDRETNLYQLNGRMCSGHVQGRLLKMITSMINPSRVIELGTFTGYSALCIAEALMPTSRIVTIESDDELKDTIISNLASSPHGEKVELRIGDALTIMDSFTDNSFDMGIIDADKREYPRYLKKMLRLIKPGGFILADNTLWDGHVTESCRHTSQTEGIIEFNNLAVADPDLEVAIIPLRDGLTIIRKR